MSEVIEKNENASAEPREKDRFILYLEGLVKRKDRAALSHLRRGLGKPPKSAMEMYPYLGQFLSEKENYNRERENAVFVVAALFAYYPDAPTNVRDLGASLRQLKDESDGIEKRFVALLNAEADELPSYLRQIIGLLKSKEVAVNWERLYKDIQFWNFENSRVRENWARSFWGNFNSNDNQTNQNTQNISGGENQ